MAPGIRSVTLVLLSRFLLGCATASAAETPESTVLEQPQIPPPGLTASTYQPIDRSGRVTWIIDGVVGPKSLAVVGVLGAGFQTALNTPSEWQQTWGGFGKRYAERLADVAISNTLEAGLGALDGEEPRYILSGRRGIWPRARYAIKTAFLAQRRDGRLAPAWGRYAGNIANNLIENTWLPPSVTTGRQTVIRCSMGLVSRLGGNAWEEFWPDVRKRLRKR